MSKHTSGEWKETRVAGSGRWGRFIETTEKVLSKAPTIAEIYPRWTKAETQANVLLFLAAPKTAAERDRLKELNVELLAVLKLARYELNAIRARDGAPQSISWDRGQPMQIGLCTEEWWNELTDKCTAAITKAEGKD